MFGSLILRVARLVRGASVAVPQNAAILQCEATDLGFIYVHSLGPLVIGP